MYKLSNKSKQRREGVDPRLIEIDDLAIQLTLVDYGHPADAGARSAERQYELFLAKKSKCDGYKNLSNHQPAKDGYGKALDVYAFVNGKASWERDHLAMVACAYFQAASILGYKIKWGGMWKSSKPKTKNGIPYGWDCPHFELVD
jgi:peptidoglycan L-alanyl-D-glutamate endopeptidase CwlK